MTRNTTRRVEVAVPVLDKDIKKRIVSMFRLMMQDNIKARIQQPDGTYVHSQISDDEINAQELFYEEAYNNAPKE